MGKNITQWLDYIQQIHIKSIDFGLERIRKVQSRLQFNHSPVIFTVGGTNGKGSTCAYLQSIFRQHGVSTGLYTSPHLLTYNERIAIDERLVSDQELIEAFERVEEARGDVPLTYFEFGTLSAWCVFEQQKPEVVILEVGMGGRLDAVNAFDSDCAIITSISLDHTQYLGQTRAAIAYEKAGIARAKRPLIVAEPDPPRTLLLHANLMEATLFHYGKDFGVEMQPQQDHWQFWCKSGSMQLPHPTMAGTKQARNAAAAIMAVEAIRPALAERLTSRRDWLPSYRGALGSARCAGRFQQLNTRPRTILDVAHNRESAEELAATLQAEQRQGRIWAVVGILNDKDRYAIVKALYRKVFCWLPCTLPGTRGGEGEYLLKILQDQGVAAPQSFNSPIAAYHYALSLASFADTILVFGSFLTVSSVMNFANTTQFSQQHANN